MGRADGKYLFCLDADDVITQNALRYFLDHFLANPDSRWAYSVFVRSGKTLNYVVGKDYWGWPHATPSDLLSTASSKGTTSTSTRSCVSGFSSTR